MQTVRLGNKRLDEMTDENQIQIYQTDDGQTTVDVRFEQKTT